MKSEKRVIVGVVLLMSFCFLGRFHLGFWFSGIGGWVFSPKYVCINSNKIKDSFKEFPEYLNKTIYPDKGIETKSCIVAKRVMIIKTREGEITPANYDLTPFVFDAVIFGSLYKRIDDPELFKFIVEKNLSRARVGFQFLLPFHYSYPNHSVYNPIDYSTLSDPVKIEKVEFWTLFVEIKKTKYELVAGVKVSEY